MHDSQLALGHSREKRCAAHGTLAIDPLSPDDLDAIRSHLQRRRAPGPDPFRPAIDARLSRNAGPARIGRPRKSALLEKSAL